MDIASTEKEGLERQGKLMVMWRSSDVAAPQCFIKSLCWCVNSHYHSPLEIAQQARGDGSVKAVFSGKREDPANRLIRPPAGWAGERLQLGGGDAVN